MKLGVSYNFFNGEEHILASLRAIREVVDHISIVSQDVSNAGQPISTAARDALATAQAEGLADQIVTFTPNLDRPRNRNEKMKRKLGLSLARTQKCTHFFTMDADEFYRAEDVKRAKESIATHGWTMTSADSFMHIRRPIHRALDTTRVSFITRINVTTRLARHFPIKQVDPTRRLTTWPRRHHHFAPDEVAMYHMNLVRQDFTSKLTNTSTTDTAFLTDVAKAIDAYDGGPTFDFPRKGTLSVTTVENEFDTYDPA